MATIFVSPQGSDSSAGTNRDPVRSLPRALALARESRAQRIELAGGMYEISQPIRLGPDDSGLCIASADEQAAVHGGPAVIDGGRRIVDWKAGTINGIKALVADVAAILEETGRPFRSLFVGGRRLPRARWPRSGYFHLQPGSGDPKADAFRGTSTPIIADPKAIPSMIDPVGSELRVLHKWVDERMPVRSYDPRSGRFECAYRSVQRITGETTGWRAERAFLENVREAVTEPGQWYLDEDERLLYLIPPEGGLDDETEVVVPMCLQLVRIEGFAAEGPVAAGTGAGGSDAEGSGAEGSDAEGGARPAGATQPRWRHAEDIRLEGLTFRHADWTLPVGDWQLRYDPYTPRDQWYRRDSFDHFVANNGLDPSAEYAAVPQAAHDVPGAIRFFAARNCAVSSCTLEHLGYYAVELGDACVGNAITANRILDIGGGGVNLDGGNDPCEPQRDAVENVISENEINGVGRVFLASCGIIVCFAARNQITNNHITDLRYTGISCGWVWGREHQVTRENLIAYNHIHGIDGLDLLSDLGGIYILGIQPGTVVRGNRIHDIHFHAYGGSGIYTDAATGNVVVEDNLIYDIQGGGITVNHHNCENVYRRNVVAFTGGNPINVMRNPKVWRVAFGDFGRAATIINNLLITGKVAPFGMAVDPDEFPAGELSRMVTSDANLIRVRAAAEGSSAPPAEAVDGWHHQPVISWDQWREEGNDRVTVHVDPGFEDLEKRAFLLPPGSPGAAILAGANDHPCLIE